MTHRGSNNEYIDVERVVNEDIAKRRTIVSLSFAARSIAEPKRLASEF